MVAFRLSSSLTLSSACVLLMACACAAPASAQSLQALYEAARAYDATYLGARAQADSVVYRAAQADALARPSLGLGVNGTRTEYNLPGYPATVGQQVVMIPGGRQGLTNWQGGLNASYALYNRSNNLTIDQAKRGLESAQADLESAEQDLIVRVAQAYFDVLAAQDTLATSRANKAAIAEQLAAAQRNFEVGTATITDTREAQARADLAIAQELAADNDLRVKRVALDQIVGRVGVEPKPLALPVALPALPSNNVDTWLAQAEATHPLIRKAQLALEVAKLESEKSRAAGEVTLALTGTVGGQYQSGEAAATPGTTTSASVGVSLNYPIYAGGAIENRLKETVKLEDKSRDDLDFARRSVEQATRQAFFGVQSLEAQVKAYEAAESSTKLALDATLLGYKVGVRVNIDVLNAQTQLYTTESNLARARYDVLVNGLKLRQAAGLLRPDDVTAVNQLLVR
ncbi:MAG: TolC family outer membrane protein [Burkholderiaceae bacterium]|nr:TolC family outer membrane protein [Roseateles sp.]MBV8468857.1 TolC family outer membrane protein [Burkholderiaceae bacterium]